MIGILCEKPSAAKNFAKALGGQKGIYNGENYVIVASHGHLYGLDDEPGNQVSPELREKYMTWSIANLPWDENDFKWKFMQKDKSDKTASQIQEVLSKCDEVCIATDDDPSGEGELLAWEVIWMKKIRVSKYTRMYFADEAPSSIQKAFKKRVLLGTDFTCMLNDPDYKQAVFRTKWDYLSMQWSRIATNINGQYGQVLRNGRLKSAMVVIVGDQLKLISEYVKKPFYQNRFRDEKGVVYINEEETKYDSKSDVPDIYSDSEVIVDSKERKELDPPKFLDLATLSATLAAKGIEAKKVLETYQSMYEAGIVSYPRTEDKCITIDQFNQLLPFVDSIARVVGVDTSLLTHRAPRKTHIKKGMAHGANRPGLTVPKSLSELGKYGAGAEEIYTILAKNYLATLCENFVYESQKGHLAKYPEFKGSATVGLSNGWKAVLLNDEDFDDEEESTKGLGTLASPFVFEGANKKPVTPTMKWLMKQLEKREVGTGATRTSTYADITNAKTKYPLLVEKRGKLSFAPCGESNYRLLIGTHIADLTMTEKVIQQMKEVAEGKTDGKMYLHDIQRMVTEDIATMTKNNGGHSGNETRKEKAEGIWAVTGNSVSFTKEWGGHKFTDEEIQSLLNGETIEFIRNDRPVRGKLDNCEYNGRKYVGFSAEGFTKNSSSSLKSSGKSSKKSKAGSNETKYTCPICGAKLKKFDWGLGCSNYAKGCKFSLGYRNPYGATFKDTELKQLLTKGKTTKKIDCLAKSGNTYKAKFVLSEETNFKAVPEFAAKGKKY